MQWGEPVQNEPGAWSRKAVDDLGQEHTVVVVELQPGAYQVRVDGHLLRDGVQPSMSMAWDAADGFLQREEITHE